MRLLQYFLSRKKKWCASGLLMAKVGLAFLLSVHFYSAAFWGLFWWPAFGDGPLQPKMCLMYSMNQYFLKIQQRQLACCRFFKLLVLLLPDLLWHTRSTDLCSIKFSTYWFLMRE